MIHTSRNAQAEMPLSFSISLSLLFPSDQLKSTKHSYTEIVVYQKSRTGLNHIIQHKRNIYRMLRHVAQKAYRFAPSPCCAREEEHACHFPRLILLLPYDAFLPSRQGREPSLSPFMIDIREMPHRSRPSPRLLPRKHHALPRIDGVLHDALFRAHDPGRTC